MNKIFKKIHLVFQKFQKKFFKRNLKKFKIFSKKFKKKFFKKFFENFRGIYVGGYEIPALPSALPLYLSDFSELLNNSEFSEIFAL